MLTASVEDSSEHLRAVSRMSDGHPGSDSVSSATPASVLRHGTAASSPALLLRGRIAARSCAAESVREEPMGGLGRPPGASTAPAVRRVIGMLIPLCLSAMACGDPSTRDGTSPPATCPDGGCAHKDAGPVDAGPVDAGPPITCLDGGTPCGRACVDMTTDVKNCRTCGNACSAGEICAATGCALTCPTAGCPSGSHCDPSSNVCVTTCASDAVCATDEICASTQCVKGCRADAACPLGERCVQYKCVFACRSSSECELDTVCNVGTGKCVAGCDFDARCKSGEICDGVTHQCRAGCTLDGDCQGSGVICDSSTRTCRSGCRGDAACPLSQVCDSSNRCVTGCHRDSTRCPAGQSCIATSATDTHCSQTACGGTLGATCQGANWQCYVVVRGSQGTSACRRQCTTNSDCPSGERCARFNDNPSFPNGTTYYFCSKPCTAQHSDCSKAIADVIGPSACVCASTGACMSQLSGGYECWETDPAWGL